MDTTTLLEDYLHFLRSGPDGDVQAIRIAGTRVGIEYVLREYLQGAGPEEMALRFPTLTLEQVHATITYFLAHREEVGAHLRRVWQRQQADWNAEQQNPSPFVQALRSKLEAAHRQANTSHRITELCGLGKEIWTGVDAQQYVDALHGEWDHDDLLRIGRECAALPVLDNRPATEILGYDELGLPNS
jgi:uncharacterized protein (DUF433 family)